MTTGKTLLGSIKVFDNNAVGYDQNSDTQYALGKKTVKNAVEKACQISRDKNLKEFRVLDCGCGNGKTTINLYVELRKALAKINPNIKVKIAGIDISRKMLDMALENLKLEGIGNIEFYQKNIHDLSQKDGKFDLIFSNFALHLCKPEIYSKFYERLNNGGAIVIQQGGKNSYKNLFDMAFETGKQEPFSQYLKDWKLPNFYPTSKELEQILKELGFKDVEVIDDEYKDPGYINLVEAFIHASILLFKEQLPDDKLKNLFEKKFRDICNAQKERYVNVHRLYASAIKP